MVTHKHPTPKPEDDSGKKAKSAKKRTPQKPRARKRAARGWVPPAAANWKRINLDEFTRRCKEKGVEHFYAPDHPLARKDTKMEGFVSIPRHIASVEQGRLITPGEVVKAAPSGSGREWLIVSRSETTKGVQQPRRFKPTKKALTKLVWSMSMLQASKVARVSDHLIGERCREMGIELPPRGYFLKGKAKSTWATTPE